MAAAGALQATIAQEYPYVRGFTGNPASQVAQWTRGLAFVMAQAVTQNLFGAVHGSKVLGHCQDETQGSLACWEGEARALSSEAGVRILGSQARMSSQLGPQRSSDNAF